MKKVIIATVVAAAFSTANAFELGVSVGKDKKVDENVYVLSSGTSLAGLKVSADATLAKDKYVSVGGSVGKQYNVWKVGVTPHVGAAYVQSDMKGKESGAVAGVGVELSLPVTKGIAIVGDYTYNWDIQNKTDFQGGLFTAGIRLTF